MSFNICYRVHLDILRALADGLNISARRFAQLHSQRESELRLLHYPAVAADDLRSLVRTRIAEHTDAGSLTLLFEDETGGLELEVADEFRPVATPPPAVLAILGDSMQHWTNGRLKATWHRVTVPPSMDDGVAIVPARYSIAYFGKPDRLASLNPFPCFVEPEDRLRLDGVGITMGEYNQAKLEKTYQVGKRT